LTNRIIVFLWTFVPHYVKNGYKTAGCFFIRSLLMRVWFARWRDIKASHRTSSSSV